MKPSPLRERVLAILSKNDQINPWGLGEIVDAVLDAVGQSSPAEITEEGTHLLGTSFLWSDTQEAKSTEHMVRRITAADQVVRSRLELEVAKLTDLLAEVEWTCDDPDSKSSALFCPRCGGLEKADGETPAGHAIGCQLAAAIDRNT